MKKDTRILLIVACVLLGAYVSVMVGAFVSCFRWKQSGGCARYEIELDNGYTLQEETDGSYSIIGLPEEAYNSSVYQVPEEIEGYKISWLGSQLRRPILWGDKRSPQSLGRVRKLILPASVKVEYWLLEDVGVFESEKKLSELFHENEYGWLPPDVYYLCPKEDGFEKLTFITKEEEYSDSVILKNQEGTAATIEYYYGTGEYQIPAEFGGLPVTAIDEHAFNSSDLTKITGGENLKYIGENAFSNIGIEAFDFLSVEEVGAGAFRNTAKLTSVVLPESLQILGDAAFSRSGVENLTIAENGLKDIPLRSFEGCPLTGEIVLPSTLTGISDLAFLGAKFTEINLPEGLISVSSQAFENCDSLKKLVFPDSVSYAGVSESESLEEVYLGKNATAHFYYGAELPSLKTITVSEENKNHFVEDGILYENASYVDIGAYPPKTIKYTSLVKCPAALEIERVETSAAIETSAFRGQKYVKEVILTTPESDFYTHEVNKRFTRIASYAFFECTALEKVVLRSSVFEIGNYAFYGCTALNEINLSSVQIVDGCAFYGCSSLQNVELHGVQTFGVNSFARCDLQRIRLTNAYSIGQSAFEGNADLEVVTINPLCDIGYKAFLNTPMQEKYSNEK